MSAHARCAVRSMSAVRLRGRGHAAPVRAAAAAARCRRGPDKHLRHAALPAASRPCLPPTAPPFLPSTFTIPPPIPCRRILRAAVRRRPVAAAQLPVFSLLPSFLCPCCFAPQRPPVLPLPPINTLTTLSMPSQPYITHPRIVQGMARAYASVFRRLGFRVQGLPGRPAAAPQGAAT